MPRPESEKVPVTLVTGFLGAGKTTLLNHILKQKGTRRVAVIENEVGEINIDNSLVVENLLSKEDLVSMDRGCVCCSLRGDIVKALETLQSRGSQQGVAYDHIMLETTGLADPAPVAFTFFSNPWISANFRLDSILCLVDAQHVARHMEDADNGEVNEAINQIAFADIVLLNKIDLVTAAELQTARDLTRAINVNADLIEVQLNSDANAELPTWERLMGINSFSIERALLVDPNFMDSDSEEDDEPGARHANKRLRASEGEEAAPAEPAADAPAAGDAAAETAAEPRPAPLADEPVDDPELAALLRKQHADEMAAAAAAQRHPKRRRKKLHDVSGVGSVGITAVGPLDKYRFNAFMRDLLSERARDIFRCKGVLCIKGQEATRFVFQGVHETICFGPAATGWPRGEEPINQIIFIGRHLQRRDLVEGFRSCVWVPLPDGWAEYIDVKTGQPYYVDFSTGKRQWERPAAACALVTVSESSHEQPSALQPSRGAGTVEAAA